MLRHRNLGAGLSIAGTAGSLAIAIALFLQAMDGGPSAYALGGWPAPFGIILVLDRLRSEEHTSELQSLMRISYAVFCLKKKKSWTIVHSSTLLLDCHMQQSHYTYYYIDN